MMNRFTVKIVLVTGGSTGIGQATALAFAREGATVVVAGRRANEGEQTTALLKAHGAEAHFVQTNVVAEAEVTRLLDQITARYGQLDIAFNNAGYEGTQGAVADLSEADWDATIDVNLKGSWLCTKYEIQQMLKQGSGVIGKRA